MFMNHVPTATGELHQLFEFGANKRLLIFLGGKGVSCSNSKTHKLFDLNEMSIKNIWRHFKLLEEFQGALLGAEYRLILM